MLVVVVADHILALLLPNLEEQAAQAAEEMVGQELLLELEPQVLPTRAVEAEGALLLPLQLLLSEAQEALV